MSKSRQPEGSSLRAPAADLPQVRAMVVRFPRGSVLPDHARGWSQLVVASSGVLRVTTAKAAWVLPPSRALWVPGGTRHRMHALTEVALQTLYFQHAPQAPCRVLERQEGCQARSACRRPPASAKAKQVSGLSLADNS